MPEIVDLEVFKGNLNKHFEGKKLKNMELGASAKIKSSEKEINDAVAGKTLHEVSRKAKELLFDFGKDALISMHQMLHGKLTITDQLPKDLIAAFHFSNGDTLVLSDYQKAANITLNPKETNVVDALSAEMTAEWLEKQLSKRRSAIKTLLTDPKIIGGIGNAYADEILWEARIHPASIANKIPSQDARKLAKAISKVIDHSIKEIKKTAPDIITGEIRDFMVVHNHRRKESPTGGTIKTTTVGSKKTYFTDEQTLFE